MARRRHPTAGLAAIGLLAVLQGQAREARGDEVARVVVLDSPGVKPFDEFVAVLRVQLRGSAGVWIGPAPAAGGLGDRVGAATELMAEKRPLLVVWVEAADERTYVVYAVGSKADRALVEVVRVPASGSLDVARVMAIKVSNLVDLILSRAAPETATVAAMAATAFPTRTPANAPAATTAAAMVAATAATPAAATASRTSTRASAMAATPAALTDNCAASTSQAPVPREVGAEPAAELDDTITGSVSRRVERA